MKSNKWLSCFSAWLQSSEHRFIDRVVRRIEAVTGLNMDTAEELQVNKLIIKVIGADIG